MSPRRPARLLPITVGLVVVALVVAITVIVVAVGRGGTPAAQPGPEVADTSSSPAPGTSVGPTRAPTPEATLASIVAQDAGSAESLVGYWVPQVSSKALGTVDAQGVHYGYAEILADFRAWETAHPSAMLLLSDRYTSFRSPGYWVTIVPQPFTSADDANGWCDAQGIGVDDCFAKRLSHTDGPDGNTEPR